MKRAIQHLFVGFVALGLLLTGCKQNSYESVSKDPMKVRIYTLDNGLKVYMSVTKDIPKVNAYVVVRAGGKNDPKDATGLAHYFEHMMFKGTSKFGTKDWAKEKPILGQIENLFEVYRTKTDSKERKHIYHQIDSLSQEAAKYAIPNEYDKLMAAIGSNGSNAMTSNDFTAYTETVPTNQLANWATVQAERFRDPVLRLFHTELETVYEEYNMGQADDDEKAYDALMNGLFPHHPYGTQTVIGKGEHLKNPSMKQIMAYYHKNYIPNNMAIVLVGDFDPNQTIKMLREKFGSLAKKELAPFKIENEKPITKPVEKSVVGKNAESVIMGYRVPKNDKKDVILADITASLLYNGQAGLIDLNINQKQLTLQSAAWFQDQKDYGVFALNANPKQGQKLEEVKDLLLGQVKKIGNGQVDPKLFNAVITNLKLNYEKAMDSNNGRTWMLLNSFVNESPWQDNVDYIKQVEAITLKDVTAFAKKYLDDRYVVVYKRQGEDKNVQKIDKPSITPLNINRNDESAFLKQIKTAKVKQIDPVFPNFQKELSFGKTKAGLEVIGNTNKSNQLFTLAYIFDFGYANDRDLKLLNTYAPLLGTATMPAEKLKSELYALGCSIEVKIDKDETRVSIEGLNENMEAALALLESYVKQAKADEPAMQMMVGNLLKERSDSKTNFNQIVDAAQNFCKWGPLSAETSNLTNMELAQLKGEVLAQKFRNLFGFKHRIAYYGPASNSEVVNLLNKVHIGPKTFAVAPAPIKYPEWNVKQNQTFLLNFDNKQSAINIGIKGGRFDKSLTPQIQLFNEYFGGGMNSIVFQDLREARALAYTAYSFYAPPTDLRDCYFNTAYIATQNDKCIDAMSAFDALLTNMPKSENAFKLAKSNLLSNLESARYVKRSLLNRYLYLNKLGLSEDINQLVYAEVKKMSYADILKFQQSFIKGKPRIITIVGKEKDINLKSLAKYGKIEKITLKDVYGY